jgi:hypothetical protein
LLRTPDFTRTLPVGHEQAWRSWLRAHAMLVRALDADLRAGHGMSLLTYDALVQLSEAPCSQIYMKDLAAALVYSASGLTRIVDGWSATATPAGRPIPATAALRT